MADLYTEYGMSVTLELGSVVTVSVACVLALYFITP